MNTPHWFRLHGTHKVDNVRVTACSLSAVNEELHEIRIHTHAFGFAFSTWLRKMDVVRKSIVVAKILPVCKKKAAPQLTVHQATKSLIEMVKINAADIALAILVSQKKAILL